MNYPPEGNRPHSAIGTGLPANGRHASPTQFLLPPLDESSFPGSGLVRHCLPMVLTGLIILVAVGSVVAFRTSMVVTVEGSGVLEPAHVWQVRATEAGIIHRLLVRTGDTVRALQPIALLDSLQLSIELAGLNELYDRSATETERAIAAAPLEERQQEVQIEDAEARLVRARAVLRERLVDFRLSDNTDSALATYQPGMHIGMDVAVSDVRGAVAQRSALLARSRLAKVNSVSARRQRFALSHLRAQILAQRERIRRLVVVSPAAGIVVTDRLDQLVGASVRQGDGIAEVADLGKWRASVFVSQADVHQVSVGDSANVDLPAVAGLDQPRLRGRVTFVASQPPVPDPRSGAVENGSYRVLVDLDQRQFEEIGIEKFKGGYQVRATITTRSERMLVLFWESLMDRLAG